MLVYRIHQMTLLCVRVRTLGQYAKYCAKTYAKYLEIFRKVTLQELVSPKFHDTYRKAFLGRRRGGRSPESIGGVIAATVT
jgi:hypothetical protein